MPFYQFISTGIQIMRWRIIKKWIVLLLVIKKVTGKLFLVKLLSHMFVQHVHQPTHQIHTPSAKVQNKEINLWKVTILSTTLDFHFSECECNNEGTESCNKKIGSCNCIPNVTGNKCDTCVDGFFGPVSNCQGKFLMNKTLLFVHLIHY